MSQGAGASAAGPGQVKLMPLRRPGRCAGCTEELSVGDRAGWDRSSRALWCLRCLASQPRQPSDRDTSASAASAASVLTACPAPSAPFGTAATVLPSGTPAVAVTAAGAPAAGVAGGSAQQEFARRSARRQDRIRSEHPRLGGLILALSSDPTSTQVWAQGALGEAKVGAALAELVGTDVEVLHDRALRRPDGRLSRANIDHLVVARSGVWVVDAKTHRGALEVRRSGGLLSPRVQRLFIAGRDRTSLLQGLAGQVEAVRRELAAVQASVPVAGALCFVGTELPWFGQQIGQTPLVGRRGLVKLLRADGELTGPDRQALLAYLAGRFPPAR